MRVISFRPYCTLRYKSHANILSVAFNSAAGRNLLPPPASPCKYLWYPKPAKKSEISCFTTDARAIARLQADHINRTLVPAFYRYLQAQDSDTQIEAGKEFHASIEGLVALFERAEKEIASEGELSSEDKRGVAPSLGLWDKDSGDLGWADAFAGPCEYLHLLRVRTYLNVTTTRVIQG